MSNVQFQEILGAIQRMSDSLGSRINWLERVVFGAVGATAGIAFLHTLGVIHIGKAVS